MRMHRGLSLAALAALALASGGADLRAAQDHHHGEAFVKCAKVCADCQVECSSCFHHCARMVIEGKKEHAKTMALCTDCAECCALAAKLSARQGPLAVMACENCAKCCDECAAACEKFKDDKHMAHCAKTCRDCAKACREMVKHAKH